MTTSGAGEPRVSSRVASSPSIPGTGSADLHCHRPEIIVGAGLARLPRLLLTGAGRGGRPPGTPRASGGTLPPKPPRPPGPARGRGDGARIYRGKAKAKPRGPALTAEAEHLLTLRETHRLNGIPPVPFEPSPLASPVTKA